MQPGLPKSTMVARLFLKQKVRFDGMSNWTGIVFYVLFYPLKLNSYDRLVTVLL